MQMSVQAPSWRDVSARFFFARSLLRMRVLPGASVPVAALLSCSSAFALTIDDGQTVTVPGSYASPWDAGSPLIVGATASGGALVISGGGVVLNEHAFLGLAPGSSGAVVVSGPGARWVNAAVLSVGEEGAGTLDIAAGGRVSNSDGVLGYAPGSAGAVSVRGAGSQWDNSGQLFVGYGGAGTLEIIDGARVSSTDGFIGTGEGAAGHVRVSGPDARWTQAGELFAGFGGDGLLEITDGGSVSNANASLGTGPDGRGRVLVSGAGSRWINAGLLTVGDGGAGRLDVADGGYVASADGAVGQGAGSVGEVLVRGAGARWISSTGLNVGVQGAGTLTVANGGSVQAPFIAVAVGNGSTGTLNVGAAPGERALAPGRLDTPGIHLAQPATSRINFNHTDDSGAYVQDSILTGRGDVSVHAGTTVLSADSSAFAGTVSVLGGRLIVAHGLGGNFTVASGGTLGGGGAIGTAGGSLRNAGTLAPGALDAPGSFSTLTVRGNYVGDDGTLVLNTALGGDDSATDRLVVQGDTAGRTAVRVNGTGAQGGQTVNGTRVIAVGGASDGRFTLANRVVAGPYEYSLHKGLPDGSGGDWYLRSEQSDGGTDSGGSGGGDAGAGGVKSPEWRPEVGAYLANQDLAAALQRHTLFDRQGAQRGHDAVWSRAIGGRQRGHAAGGQVDQDTDYALLHVGGDVGLSGRDDLRLGLMGSWGQGRTHAGAQGNRHRATGELEGYSLGLYATWHADGKTRRGAYADAWLQYGRYRNQVKGDLLQPENYDSRVISASLETGYQLILAEGASHAVRLTPQAQIIHSRQRADGYAEQTGTVIDHSGDGTVQTRLGMRLSRDGAHDGGDLRPYVEANWWHADRNLSIAFNGIDVNQGAPRRRWELKSGLQGAIGKNWTGWIHAGLQRGDSDYRQLEGMAGFSYRW
ncbi:autotransporter outer membrane beta-barrel domain-containing protein [Propionivibrio sp.]|uniref:autotransporter family protein n=1 Tax=Propionivibrio sp. TaxID=2212460 RepID=UPI0039E25D4D